MQNVRVVALMALFAALCPAAANNTGTEQFKLLALTAKDDGSCEGPDCVAVLLIHGIYGTVNDANNRCDLNAVPPAKDCYWEPLIDHLRAQPSIWPKIRIYIFRYISSDGYSTMAIGNALRGLIDSPPANCVNYTGPQNSDHAIS